MNLGITNLIANLGMKFEFVIIIIALFSSLPFYAKNFLLGTVINFIISGVIFMWFYLKGFEWGVVLILFFVNLIVLSLSLWAVHKAAAQGRLI